MTKNKLFASAMGLLFVTAMPESRAQSEREAEQSKAGQLDIFSMIQPIPPSNMFIDSLYNIWCGSVIKGKNNKYYMFYSRWPRNDGHYAWVNKSEIALAVSDSPGGPYKHLKTVLQPRGSQYWDGVCTHNPYVINANGKYYLFYMGTTGISALQSPITMRDPNWWEYRNNQRIGVAVAGDPEGSWLRNDHPVLDISQDSTAFDALLVSNPSVTIDDQGKVLLIYKGVGNNGQLRGGPVRFGAAFSASPAGPFKKHDEPIFTFADEKAQSSHMLAEDPFIWYSGGTYLAIVRDVVDYFNKGKSTLALLQSTDGIHWEPAPHPAVAPYRLFFADGRTSDDKIERPWLLLENGKPVILFGAMGIQRRSHSMNVAVPLRKTAP